ncbi:hypothetical protein Arub01_55320 [Actinomadura rubrobrunea]|uniref:Uncharacterized protein n=1 Tax=Actinomadura rubrobrunea TaxID=115335 RepID=A0A9W6PZM3_9ACTN|nr:hypothetical protein Arub01_55320 [Actinomadura rubrobrunea]
MAACAIRVGRDSVQAASQHQSAGCDSVIMKPVHQLQRGQTGRGSQNGCGVCRVETVVQERGTEVDRISTDGARDEGAQSLG